MTTLANDRAADPADPALIDMARVIAEKYEYSAQENLREAESWEREAEQYAHLPAYATWAKSYAEIFRRHARQDQDVARRNRRYIERARAANGTSTG